MTPSTQSTSVSLDSCFAFVRDLHGAGWGVEFLLSPEPEDEVCVSLLLPSGVTEEWKAYGSWKRLEELAARHGMEPDLHRDKGTRRMVVTFNPVAA